MNRRKFLSSFAQATTAGIITTALPSISQAALPLTYEKTLKLRNLHTNERLTATYSKDGIYDPAALADINAIMRDHRADETAEMSLQLLDMLSLLQDCCGNQRELQIISAYRSPRTNEQLRKNSSGVAKKSLHMQGKAIDIRVSGVALNEVRQHARRLKAGGVGYYPESGFIHVDTGRVRYWG